VPLHRLPADRRRRTRAGEAARENPAALRIDDGADRPLREIRRDAEPTTASRVNCWCSRWCATRKGHVFLSPSTVAEVAQALHEHPGRDAARPARPRSA